MTLQAVNEIFLAIWYLQRTSSGLIAHLKQVSLVQLLEISAAGFAVATKAQSSPQKHAVMLTPSPSAAFEVV